MVWTSMLISYSHGWLVCFAFRNFSWALVLILLLMLLTLNVNNLSQNFFSNQKTKRFERKQFADIRHPLRMLDKRNFLFRMSLFISHLLLFTFEWLTWKKCSIRYESYVVVVVSAMNPLEIKFKNFVQFFFIEIQSMKCVRV